MQEKMQVGLLFLTYSASAADDVCRYGKHDHGSLLHYYFDIVTNGIHFHVNSIVKWFREHKTFF